MTYQMYVAHSVYSTVYKYCSPFHSMKKGDKQEIKPPLNTLRSIEVIKLFIFVGHH